MIETLQIELGLKIENFGNFNLADFSVTPVMAPVNRPACCISHQFHHAASNFPDKIAVIHATGFPTIASDFRRNQPSDSGNSQLIRSEMSSYARPPVYAGDDCFTFSEILSAVEILSHRLRRILDGAHDCDIVVPRSANLPNFRPVQHSKPSVQQSIELANTYTPKIIGVYMEPSVEYIVSVLSILRCGEAFMPLDPTWPKARVLSVISYSKPSLVIGYKSLSEENTCHKIDTLQWLIDDCSCQVLPISMDDNVREKRHDPLILAWPCESERLRSFCYLMYTSGSIGKPKGVCGTEIGLLNRFLWMQDLYPLDKEDLLLFKTSISFIDHLQEFLGSVLSTCTLVIPPFNQIKENILYVVDFLQGYLITRLVGVPSLMRAILPDLQISHYISVQNSLKLLVLSGEVLNLSLYEKLFMALPETSILNLYGSTEVTGDCTYFDCKRLPLIYNDNEPLSTIPIGLPISNCDMLLIGENAPNQGEVHVGGVCLAAGYYNPPFIIPLEHDQSHHYFRTGDFAQKLPSGDLVFLGRKDRTIKVNGQRIALEEIETVLREHPDLVDAAVISREIEGEILILEAHLVSKKSVEENENFKSLVRSWVRSKLPKIMVPSRIFFTESLPLTSSGKVDYSSLADTTRSEMNVRNSIEDVCGDDLLHVIKKVFSDALSVEKVSTDDNFFSMGGDSISAAYASFKLGIHMNLLYTYPTPWQLQLALSSSNFSRKADAQSEFNKPLARVFLSNHRDATHPLKLLKTESKYTKHTFCSFSRCNKSAHRGDCEKNDISALAPSKILREHQKGFMQQLWKVGMDSCVDASPLVVFMGSDVRVFIGSHSHKFVSIDAKSGNICWETKLQGRVECSATILDDFSQVVVGCYEGKIYFLDSLNGSVCWSFQTGGEVKSQPVVDKCRHLVWCGSYDHYLYAIDYESYQCSYKLPCGGSIFGSPVIDEMQEKLFVATTNGHVTALSIKALPFSKLWNKDLGAPIFGSLSMNSSNGNVICCLVDGTTAVINSFGSIVWKARTGGPIFAGPTISQALESQVLVCSRDGSLYSFETETGNLLWTHDFGKPITSSAYVDESLHLISDISNRSHRFICVCDSSGSIHVLRIDLNPLGGLNRNVVQEFGRFDLKGDIFSSPVMVGGRIFVGCRDDYLYCIKTDTENAA